VDPLFEQASRLVTVAHTQAAASNFALLSEFPILESVPLESWDFFVTVAGVFVATTRLASFPEEREAQLTTQVVANLNEWSPRGLAGLRDCEAFFERTCEGLSKVKDPNFIAADSLGMWIVWNVLERRPAFEDMGLVRAIGGLTIARFCDWWL
jgi:hypothetical protein